MNKELKIKITKNGTTFETVRSNLISCDETPDGVAFQFKGGIILQYTDVNMPPGTKNIVKNTVDRMTNGNLSVNFDNPSNPISLLAD